MMPPAPMMPPPRAKKSKVPALIVVFGLLSVIFMGIALVTPWYNLKMEVGILGVSTTMDEKFDFNGVTASFGGMSNSTAWKDMKSMDKTKGVYRVVPP